MNGGQLAFNVQVQRPFDRANNGMDFTSNNDICVQIFIAKRADGWEACFDEN
jgi:hypothetical protein